MPKHPGAHEPCGFASDWGLANSVCASGCDAPSASMVKSKPSLLTKLSAWKPQRNKRRIQSSFAKSKIAI